MVSGHTERGRTYRYRHVSTAPVHRTTPSKSSQLLVMPNGTKPKGQNDLCGTRRRACVSGGAQIAGRGEVQTPPHFDSQCRNLGVRMDHKASLGPTQIPPQTPSVKAVKEAGMSRKRCLPMEVCPHFRPTGCKARYRAYLFTPANSSLGGSS